MEREQDLFRSQVIDELNSKLNGEILLNPSFTFARIILFAVLWLSLMATLHHFVKIKSPQIINGNLVSHDERGLVARFTLPVDYLSQISAGDLIEIQLLGISEKRHIGTTIHISHIDQTLSLFNSSQGGEIRTAGVNVEGELKKSSILIENETFFLTEGIEFSFTLNNQQQRILPWLQRYFAVDK